MARKSEGTEPARKPAKKAAKQPGKPRRKKGAYSIKGLSAPEVTSDSPPAEVEALAQAVRESGGGVVGSYRDPVGGHWHIIASLPIEKVEPTPFQRDISKTHVERLGDVIGRMGRFLDPIIAVRTPEGIYWTPNGHHRLGAMRKLGASSILAVVVPEMAVAYQILAMNTEKGHNLREKSLEVIRMARSLSELDPGRPEKEYSLEFEESDYLTLGLAYEKRGRLSGGAYHPVLKRVEEFLDTPLTDALRTRETRADKLIALDDKVAEAVTALKGRGFTSPYLKTFVVARLNPLRFRRGATMSADAALDAMMTAVEKFDAGKVKVGDLAAAPPGPADEG
jgi:ParB family chromosome partitioning protein